MWQITGHLVIPRENQLQIVDTKGRGVYFNFKAVTQGNFKEDDTAIYEYWDCSMWVPKDKESEWEDKVAPGNIFYVQYGHAHSTPVLEGKYHNTKIRLDYSKTKLLEQPLWIKK